MSPLLWKLILFFFLSQIFIFVKTQYILVLLAVTAQGVVRVWAGELG